MPTHKILADLDVGGEVKGTSLDLNGNAQIDGTVTVGIDDTGYDVKFFGATSSRFLQWDESEDYLLFRDNVKGVFGNGADLKLYHDASNSYIENGTGNLYIMARATDADISFQSDDGSGGDAEYFRLDGGDVATRFSKQLVMQDNVNFAAGSGVDLRIYHDATNSYIHNDTGSLYIENDLDDGSIYFRGDNGSGGLAVYFQVDGASEILQVHKDLYALDNVKLRAGAAGDLYMQHDGTNSYLQNTTGDLYIQNGADDKDIILRSDDGSGGQTAYITLDGSSSKVLVSRPAIFYDTIEMASYIYHNGDTNSYFGFSAADTFNLHVGGAEVLRVNGGSTTDEAAVSILCGGGTNVENIALLLKGDTNGEALKLKIQNPNNGGTLTGAGILSYEPDADTFNIGQSTTHANMAISIDNSENVTLAAALTATGNITANGNIIGDDSTNITNIASIGADTYSADADSTTRIGMGATSMDFLVEDEDVFNCSSTTLTVDAKFVAKKRVLAKTSNTDANADGDIVYFGGTTSMDAGKIYYFNSSGAWALADADAESTAKGMLGVALGSASDTNGVLIRGMVTLDTDPGTIGDTVFLSTTAGVATSTAPSGSGDIVRVIGYCLDSTNGQIYFNPDGAFVEVA